MRLALIPGRRSPSVGVSERHLRKSAADRGDSQLFLGEAGAGKAFLKGLLEMLKPRGWALWPALPGQNPPLWLDPRGEGPQLQGLIMARAPSIPLAGHESGSSWHQSWADQGQRCPKDLRFSFISAKASDFLIPAPFERLQVNLSSGKSGIWLYFSSESQWLERWKILEPQDTPRKPELENGPPPAG